MSYCVVRCWCCTTPCTTLYDASYIPDASGPDALYDTPTRRTMHFRQHSGPPPPPPHRPPPHIYGPKADDASQTPNGPNGTCRHGALLVLGEGYRGHEGFANGGDMICFQTCDPTSVSPGRRAWALHFTRPRPVSHAGPCLTCHLAPEEEIEPFQSKTCKCTAISFPHPRSLSACPHHM